MPGILIKVKRALNRNKYKQALRGLFTVGTSTVTVAKQNEQQKRSTANKGLNPFIIRSGMRAANAKGCPSDLAGRKPQHNERYYRKKNWDDQHLQSRW